MLQLDLDTTRLVIEMASALGDMINVIENELKCHSCEIGPRAGKSRLWYKCLTLHSICEYCNTNGFCKCGKELSTTHCKMTEELLKLKSMRFQCANESRGCQEIMLEEAICHFIISCFRSYRKN